MSYYPGSGEQNPSRRIARRTPAKGVHVSINGPNWVFLTVCTQKRERWLAQPSVQRTLHDLWENVATAWLVSDYLLMPDHLHLFCAPHDLKFTIESWIGFWKNCFAKMNSKTQHQPTGREQIVFGKFQSGGFHHRLRNGESYAQKWKYVRENPVLAGLVASPDDWLYQGRVHEIRW
jgi:putative transposase